MFGASKSEKRMKEIEETLERIERAFKKLEVEWTDTYDKFRQLHWRVAKRVKTLEAQAPDEGGPQPEGGSVEAQGPSNSTLSPRARLVQQQILARRNRQSHLGGE